MNRAIRQARDFTADFENMFAWHVERANADVARRFQKALDHTLMKLSALPDLGRPRHFRHPKLQGLRSSLELV